MFHFRWLFIALHCFPVIRCVLCYTYMNALVSLSLGQHCRHWLIVLSHITISSENWFGTHSVSIATKQCTHCVCVHDQHIQFVWLLSLCKVQVFQLYLVMLVPLAFVILCLLLSISLECSACVYRVRVSRKTVLSKRYWIKLIILFWGKQPVGGVSELFDILISYCVTTTTTIFIYFCSRVRVQRVFFLSETALDQNLFSV